MWQHKTRCSTQRSKHKGSTKRKQHEATQQQKTKTSCSTRNYRRTGQHNKTLQVWSQHFRFRQDGNCIQTRWCLFSSSLRWSGGSDIQIWSVRGHCVSRFAWHTKHGYKLYPKKLPTPSEKPMLFSLRVQPVSFVILHDVSPRYRF